ncbi:MAG: isoprenylcysteine carboxyl methyltransferase family protein [Thermobispora bispora]|nr:isoprenylcysteine carboxyl methyltransferase family protein [Thermobispora bispora]
MSPWPGSPWYVLLVALVAMERLAELVVARRNARWSLARGGVVYGRGHYPWMVALHTGLLAGCLTEVWPAHRPFIPALGWPMLGLVLAAQALRWWCVVTLGPQWNTQVIVVPGLPLVTRGPYRWLRHPNYVAVAVEGAALPLVHSAWLTALAFTLLNVPLMAVRVRCENAALATAAGPAARDAGAGAAA